MELGCWAGRKALRGFLLSTTAALSFSGGLTMQAGPASAQQGQAAGALPSVVVSAPQQRARRAQTATASRAARSNRRTTTVAPVEKKPPSVNNQDARTGQKGYVTRSVTSATKTNTALLNVPQSVTVLTKDFIRDQAFTSIGEATRYVPGVIYHQGESHRDDLVIRGQRSNADFYTNGIRDDVQYFRDFYNIQRLEVLKGPNAMIFGRGGGGGVVNRVLKEADGTTIREVTVGGNSYPGARVTTDVGQAINENWAFRLNAMYENTQS
jgi:catecholate siderophore receptor